jgi:cytochrome bd-type quinol oxidase subunit 1
MILTMILSVFYRSNFILFSNKRVIIFLKLNAGLATIICTLQCTEEGRSPWLVSQIPYVTRGIRN